MTVQSMTGFARVEGGSADSRWIWELRSVNGKGLDIRARLPQGFERYEPEIRRMCSDEFKRGNIQVALSLTGGSAGVEPVLNEAALSAIIEIAGRLGERIDAERPSIDGLLNIRGILDFREPQTDPAAVAAADAELPVGPVAGDRRAQADARGGRRGAAGPASGPCRPRSARWWS